MKEAVVNTEQCAEVAKALARLRIRDSFYEREFISLKVEPETKARMYLFSAAICHQTHSLQDKDLKGWEYMEKVFTELGKARSELIDPNNLTRHQEQIVGWLKMAFTNEKGDCTLDLLEERALMMNELAKWLKEQHGAEVVNVLEETEGYLLNKGKGLYELLGETRAFADPLRKKSTVFLKHLLDARLYKVRDEENIVPGIDYHVQRVLLRMGCVEIEDEELKERLWNKEPLDSDSEIRNACVEAIRQIAQKSGKELLQVNDFLWPLGRSCCHETTLCQNRKCRRKPCTFQKTVEIKVHERCAFEAVCKGSTEQNYRAYWQPIVKTDFY
ncbi:MAG: hypothetical protein V1837_00035 [Candidatus Woesearchaeota archaeon]